ncbi:hypothetical protein HHI36_005064 [Cryptolaemus montrouzieri]|uniref:Uncharacterized protein n=1 Tax=Cryptolaemus montrouzieri TaxID=559131 RepID=A0ABD2NTK1_9CUCU
MSVMKRNYRIIDKDDTNEHEECSCCNHHHHHDHHHNHHHHDCRPCPFIRRIVVSTYEESKQTTRKVKEVSFKKDWCL